VTAGDHGLRTPATFRGDLPCADCEAVRWHLDLYAGQGYGLRREWVGRDVDKDEVGTWRFDSLRTVLVLEGGNEMPLEFEVLGPGRLRLIDTLGAHIESKLPYELVSDGRFEPTPLTLFLGGEFTYMADAAGFTECMTGLRYPVAMEGDFVQLERAYLAAVSQPGAPLYVTFEGSLLDRPRMEGEGTERTVVVDRFVNVWPGERCERARAAAALPNTYWKIATLAGERVDPVEGRREPHLILRSGPGQGATYSATVGCNRLAGTFTVDGDGLRFSPGATTPLPCPPPLDALEGALVDVLENAARWHITGNTLELFDAGGASLALLAAVYF
jgi:heat shock protein HslJ/uncharacterized lipoprotein NlpE involved in copper resistance